MGNAHRLLMKMFEKSYLFEMSSSRKEILDCVRELQPAINEHLFKFLATRNIDDPRWNRDKKHWQNEVCHFLHKVYKLKFKKGFKIYEDDFFEILWIKPYNNIEDDSLKKDFRVLIRLNKIPKNSICPTWEDMEKVKLFHRKISKSLANKDENWIEYVDDFFKI